MVERHIRALPDLCPACQVLQYVIMPDHIHFALFARERLPLALGQYIGMMKVKCGQAIRESYPELKDIFTPDFHDRYLRPTHNLNDIFEYIRNNPRRLLAIRQNPDFFRRINSLTINGTQWQAFGNLHLLDNPFKLPVIVHRADSPEVRAANTARWMHLAENGGVLVSAFISPDEKAVRKHGEAAGGRFILLTNRPFREREKPALHDFTLCTEGRLLILAPADPLPPGRQTFLFLNATAEKLAPPPPR